MTSPLPFVKYSVYRDGVYLFSEMVTSDELLEWDRYANSHNHLVAEMHESTLRMFLSHFRRGINLNTPIPTHSNHLTTYETTNLNKRLHVH